MANQQESQAIENSCMSDGFMPQVEPTDARVIAAIEKELGRAA